jgi:putative transposase
MIKRAYKYRVYPTKQQAAYLNEVFGCVRFVWNQLVANFNSWTPDGPNRPMNEKSLKDMPEYSWLAKTISYALQQKRMDFDETKSQYFNKSRKKKPGRMRFKKKSVARDSFRIPVASMGGQKSIDLDNGRIKLPKMTTMKLIVDRKFMGTAKSVTVSKNKIGQFFVSVLVEEDVKVKTSVGRSIGIDLGLSCLATLSNGVQVKNPRLFRKSQAKLRKEQKHLSRKKKGSNRYEKQRRKVARVHLKIKNQRSWAIHNLTTAIVNAFDTIMVEDLNVAGMKKLFGKSISDAAFGEILSQLEYKSSWYGRVFHKIDRWYPSSKTCNCCGHKMDTMTLDIREWTCTNCGTHHDRDLNAAKNILDEGLRDLYGFTSDELADYRRGEEVRHASSGAFLDEAFRLFCL